MMTCDTVVTSDGQVLVPKEVLESLNAKPGDDIRFFLLPHACVHMVAINLAAGDLAGRYYREGQPTVSIDEMSR